MGRLNSSVRWQKSVWWFTVQRCEFFGFGQHCSSDKFSALSASVTSLDALTHRIRCVGRLRKRCLACSAFPRLTRSLRLHPTDSLRVRVRTFPLRLSASAQGFRFGKHPQPPNNSFKPTPCRGIGHVRYATLAHVRRPATGRLNSGVSAHLNGRNPRMDLALCTLDNTPYNSFQFSHLSAVEISERRRHLVCPECRGPAFFRKQTKNGRAACFGARPHQPNCSLSAFDETRIIEGYGEVTDIINNPGERIVVDLNFGAATHVHAEPYTGPTRGGARAGIHIGGASQNHARMHRRLSSLLRTLIESPNFRESQQILEILGREISVKDFFVPLLEIEDFHLNSLRGFWGMISDIREDQSGSIWLNSGGRDNISFCLDEASFSNIRNRFNITDKEDFSGAYVLVIGEATLSKNKKVYCSVQNQDLICLRLT